MPIDNDFPYVNDQQEHDEIMNLVPGWRVEAMNRPAPQSPDYKQQGTNIVSALLIVITLTLCVSHLCPPEANFTQEYCDPTYVYRALSLTFIACMLTVEGFPKEKLYGILFMALVSQLKTDTVKVVIGFMVMYLYGLKMVCESIDSRSACRDHLIRSDMHKNIRDHMQANRMIRESSIIQRQIELYDQSLTHRNEDETGLDCGIYFGLGWFKGKINKDHIAKIVAILVFTVCFLIVMVIVWTVVGIAMTWVDVQNLVVNGAEGIGSTMKDLANGIGQNLNAAAAKLGNGGNEAITQLAADFRDFYKEIANYGRSIAGTSGEVFTAPLWMVKSMFCKASGLCTADSS